MTAPVEWREQPGSLGPAVTVEDGRAADSLRARLLDHPLSLYYLLAGATLLLLALGLVMVWSASAIESIKIFGSPYELAGRQLLFAGIGVVGMLVASRLPPTWFARTAWLALIIAVVLLVLVLLVGRSVAGQRNWIELFGPFRFQPSEVAKLALVVWSANLLARKDMLLDRWSHLLLPLLPVTGLLMVLVLAEGDFGNALVLGLIAAGVLFVAGAPLRLFAGLAALAGLGVVALSLAAPYRLERFSAWLDPAADRLDGGWQLMQGTYALGTGGWWGVGLGASREKWGSLPEAHTDFILPVIGEELGLVGTLLVLALFAVLGIAAFRLARGSADRFTQLAAAGVGSWILAQAVVNIGGVLGLLPITGVPLPLVSYGGSSLIPVLLALGMLMAFARRAGRAARPGAPAER
ncbi:MAG: putative lipid II flippase FtsW [Actinomycetota bacterium]|nr:MAG: putative lipid II flippase FtsW [Actinomycetota bacterium]